jgi:hypothetical protein
LSQTELIEKWFNVHGVLETRTTFIELHLT